MANKEQAAGQVEQTRVAKERVETKTQVTNRSEAGQIMIGADQQFKPESRPLTTNSDTTVSVPDDYATVQEAVNQIPLFVRHLFVIDIADGDYSDEHVQVPQVSVPNVRDGRSSPNLFLSLSGNDATPGNVKLGSVVTSGNAGVGMSISGIRTTEGNPEDDEDEGIGSYWDNYLLVKNCEVRGSTSGILAYQSHVHVNGVDFGTDSNKYALRAKKGGKITEQGGAGQACTGTTTDSPYVAGGGPVYAARDISELSISAVDGNIAKGRFPVFDTADKRYLNGYFRFAQRIYPEGGVQITNQEWYRAEKSDGNQHPLMRLASNDDVILNLPAGKNLLVQGEGGNYGLRATDGLGFMLSTEMDLTSNSGDTGGEIRRHDGSGSNQAGYYEWANGEWHGMGRAAGTTITP